MGYPGSLPGAEYIFYLTLYFRQNGFIGQPKKTLLWAGLLRIRALYYVIVTISLVDKLLPVINP